MATTPPNTSNPVQVHETPSVARRTSQWKYLTGQLDLAGLAVMEDLRSIPVVPLDFLFNVLPPLPPTLDLDKLQAGLRSGNVVQNNGWRGFETPPKGSEKHESLVFKPLVEVFNDIVKSVSEDNALSPNRANSSKPDGFLELLERKSVDTDVGRFNWEDIPVSMEFKKSESTADVHDVESGKDHLDLHHMMRNDPSRRFAFGITIENAAMRVWFCCRSVFLVSERFDFLRDHGTVIRLFVSLAFGTIPQLGYDPTVRRIKQDGGAQYELAVGDKTYRTASVLSDFGADPLLGRGTRVFKVYDTNDPSRTPRALKDVWVETDRRREGNILADLFGKIGLTSQGEDLEVARRHFLTVLCHGDVIIDGKQDHTSNLLGGENLPAECDDMQLPVTLFRWTRASEGSQIASTGGVQVNPCTRIPAQRTERVPSRAHYRIVFEEVGLAVHDLASLPKVCQALHDAVEGLRIMHAHGYVHRDISTGNIIFHNGHGKIADLEYAKEVGTGEAHEVQMGTVYFTALEVASQQYMFMPRPSDEDHLQRMLFDETPPSEPENINLVPFTYNPLHDLESIWWVATFFIFHHFTIGGHNRRLLDTDVAKLFPTSDDKSRSLAFASEGFYTEMIGHLPAALQRHGKKLDIYRQLLLNIYASAESMPDINKAAFDLQRHKTFGAVFVKLRDDPGSLAACVNEPKKQSLADEREEVNKSFGDVASSPSAGKGKIVNKQTSTGERVVDDGSSVPRRSTRTRKVVHEQVVTDDDEHFEHAEPSHSARKRNKVNDRKDDMSFRAAESSHSAGKRKEANEQNLTEDDERFEDAESSHSTRKRKKVNERKDDQSFGPAKSSRPTKTH